MEHFYVKIINSNTIWTKSVFLECLYQINITQIQIEFTSDEMLRTQICIEEEAVKLLALNKWWPNGHESYFSSNVKGFKKNKNISGANLKTKRFIKSSHESWDELEMKLLYCLHHIQVSIIWRKRFVCYRVWSGNNTNHCVNYFTSMCFVLPFFVYNNAAGWIQFEHHITAVN